MKVIKITPKTILTTMPINKMARARDCWHKACTLCSFLEICRTNNVLSLRK